MIGPAIASRIEQGANLPCHRIDACQVRTFAQIAAMTGEGQIAGIAASAMLAGNYVFDVMRERTTFLGKQTIFAAVSGSGSDECPRRLLHRLRFVRKLLSGF